MQKSVQRRLLVPALALGLTALALPATFASAQETASPAIELSPLGTYESGAFAESAAEIVAHDPESQRLFVVNALAGVVDVLDVSDPAAPVKAFELDASAAMDASGWTVNSVAVHDGLVAVAAQAPVKTDDGKVLVFGDDGSLAVEAQAGAQPDSIAFTPDGAYIVVADEGEPADDYSADPDGTVTVIDTDDFSSRTADFSAWAGGARDLPEGFRVFGPEADDIAAGIEPEYVVAPDGDTAYVTLQENNAIAVVDLAAAEITDLHALGTKDHLAEGNELDASNRDDEINLASWPVSGMYLPDGFDVYETGGQTYLVTANEGDTRDWDAYSEEERVADLELCADAFPGYDLAELQADENLGRLKVTTSAGRTEAGCFDELYSFGGRSFSIWTTGGDLVFDSGSDFERVIAEVGPDHFNADNEENDFDDRSDDKGPEPEAVAIGRIGERAYAFIALERQGGVMVYDVTDPAEASFTDYVTTRDFTVEPGAGDAGDLGPESLAFITAADSPSGLPMLAVGNEVSGTTTLFDVAGPIGTDETAPTPTEEPSAGAKLPRTGTGATGLLLALAAALGVGGIALLVSRRREA